MLAGRDEGREARGGERAAAGQGVHVGAQRHAGAFSKVFIVEIRGGVTGVTPPKGRCTYPYTAP